MNCLIPKQGAVAKALMDGLGKRTLRHLDISFNSLNNQECHEIQLNIKKDHYLIGLHMIGNDCYLDPFGFVHASTQNHKQILKQTEKHHEVVKTHIEFDHKQADPLYGLRYKYRHISDPLTGMQADFLN